MEVLVMTLVNFVQEFANEASCCLRQLSTWQEDAYSAIVVEARISTMVAIWFVGMQELLLLRIRPQFYGLRLAEICPSIRVGYFL